MKIVRKPTPVSPHPFLRHLAHGDVFIARDGRMYMRCNDSAVHSKVIIEYGEVMVVDLVTGDLLATPAASVVRRADDPTLTYELAE